MLGLFILWHLRVFHSGRFLLPHLLSEKHKIQEKFNHHLRSLTGHFIGVKKLAPSPSFDSMSFIATPTLNKISGGSTCTTASVFCIHFSRLRLRRGIAFANLLNMTSSAPEIHIKRHATDRREEKTLLSSLFVCCSKFVEVNQFRGHLVSLF
ncbi:hypothetical protein OUZ56_024775 [Daphnia magna]|uniref:Secreted protein n=1 Tax=Daphnia magna TaxID=35525 RepID=A0ABQ9ZHZ5_9CRUS|nr:hypothetical protein OUZ56_024775 [Daphnia magna]